MTEEQVVGMAELLAGAQEDYTALRLAAALEAYQAALARDPQSFQAHLGLARTLSRMRREGEALAAAQRALELAPERPEAHALTGVLHFMADRFPEATTALEKAIALAPEDPEPYVTQSQVYTDLHDYAKANAALLTARERISALRDEDEREALAALAWHAETYLRLAEGKEQEAIDCAHEVLALERANPYAACLAHSNLGIISARKRQYDQAIEHLERAVAMNPFMYRVAGALGRVLLARGKNQRAAVVLKQALDQTPPGAVMPKQPKGINRYVYALALARSGQGQAARPEFAQALQEGLTGIELINARWQLIWLDRTARMIIIGVVLVLVLAWVYFFRPSTQVITLLLLLGLILVLQRVVGRGRGR